MKKKGILILVLSFLFTFQFNLVTFASEVNKSSYNAGKLGFWTLIPPIIAIVLAFISKNVILSLFLGVFSGTFLLQLASGQNVINSICNGFFMVLRRILTSLSSPWNAGIILQCLAIGGLIALISKMGGAKAIAESLSKRAKSPVSVQIITWVLGIIVFFDDYANSLIVGPIMYPIADKMKVSREKLSFIIDSTAAPIAGIALISTWVGYEVSLIKNGFSQIGIKMNAYATFVSTIPYRFYNILIIIFILFIALMFKEIGPMYKAEKDSRLGLSDYLNDDKDIEDLQPKQGVKLSVWNAIIPIAILVFGALIGFYVNGYNSVMSGNNKELINLFKTHPMSFSALREAFSASDASIVLFEAAMFASICAMIMGTLQKSFKIKEAIDIWIDGAKTLLITGAILLLAWSLSSVIQDLGTAKFLVSILSDKIPSIFLPTIIFILSSIISFATGTSYGTMGILMPLTIPLAHAVSLGNSRYLIITISSVLTGAIFGDHCSPISDTTILSSMGAKCNHIAHVKTQMPYAAIVAIVSAIFGYIPVTIGFPIYIVLPVDCLILFLILKFFGKSIKEFN